MNSRPLQSTLREMQLHFGDFRVLGVMLVCGLVLGFAGPFGTFGDIAMAPRVVYWTAIAFGTYGAGFALSSLADALWGEGRPIWLRAFIMVVPAGIGATLVVALINFITFGAESFSWDEMALLTLQCFGVALGVVAILLLTIKGDTAGEADEALPPILDRVPLPQRGKLLALVVEDHYVEIITDRGKTLVLMRLADAIRETGTIPGLQIHRSHWVALGAVARTLRSDGKAMVELSNGLRLPISRGYLPAARAAGLG